MLEAWRASLVLVAAALCFQMRPGIAQTAAPQPLQGSPGKSQGNDDRPYDAQLLRLSELLGALHYLRELCGASEGQTWREAMRELVAAESGNALRRAKFVESFNRGYRGYARTYRTCTVPALTAIQRFVEQGNILSDSLIASEK